MSNAPDIIATQWLNRSTDLSLADWHGKVIVIHAFQMLCPGCVTHGLPQAQRLHELYQQAPLTVIGLHSVFEHHEVMTADALQAFVSEYRFTFPIAIDAPSLSPANPIPQTMARYQLRGTPSLIVIDSRGNLQLQHFGRIDDLHLGSLIGQLIADVPINTVHDNNTNDHPENQSECHKEHCTAVRD